MTYIRSPYPNELYHHGIKGQKWGVRRFQNPDGTLTAKGRKRYVKTLNKASKRPSKIDRVDMGLTEERTIPAGTKMYRTSATKNEQKAPGESAYVTYLQPERNLYRGGWVRQTAGKTLAYEKTYKLKSDLKIPSRSTCEKEIKILMKKPEYRKEVINGYIDACFPKDTARRAFDVKRLIGENSLSDIETYRKAEKKWVTKKGKEIADEFKTMPLDQAAYRVQQSFGLAPKAKAKLIENLKSKGYGAMVDEASVGGRFGWTKEGIDPLIVFDASVLKATKQSTLSGLTEGKYLQEYQKWQNKAMTNASAKWSEF